MITNFKIFESLNQNEPNVGDYVICKDMGGDIKLNNFLSRTIGIVKKSPYKERRLYYFDDIDKEDYDYLVEFDGDRFTILPGFHSRFIRFAKSEILYWSKNKEDLEIYLAQQKYNL